MSYVRVVLLAAALLLAAFAVVRAVARPAPYATLARPARVAAAPAHDPPEPVTARGVPSVGVLRSALRALDSARARAFASPASADPDAWAARSCACRDEDVRRLRRLASAGLTLRGQRTRLLGLALVRAGPARAEILVTDRVTAYAAVDRSDSVTQRWPASAVRRWSVTLVRLDSRWLLAAVARAP